MMAPPWTGNGCIGLGRARAVKKPWLGERDRAQGGCRAVLQFFATSGLRPSARFDTGAIRLGRSLALPIF
jgi:hypothetical protein